MTRQSNICRCRCDTRLRRSKTSRRTVTIDCCGVWRRRRVFSCAWCIFISSTRWRSAICTVIMALLSAILKMTVYRTIQGLCMQQVTSSILQRALTELLTKWSNRMYERFSSLPISYRPQSQSQTYVWKHISSLVGAWARKPSSNCRQYEWERRRNDIVKVLEV